MSDTLSRWAPLIEELRGEGVVLLVRDDSSAVAPNRYSFQAIRPLNLEGASVMSRIKFAHANEVTKEGILGLFDDIRGRMSPLEVEFTPVPEDASYAWEDDDDDWGDEDDDDGDEYP